MKKSIVSILLILISFSHIQSQSLDSTSLSKKNLKQSVYTDPILPFFGLLIVNYGYQYNSHHEGVLGLVLSKSTTTPTEYLEYPGYINSIGLNLGHRIYLYRGLHLDTWLIPAYNRIYEENEDQFYNSFSLYLEFRIGYKFDFKLGKVPLLVDISWPVGLSLVDTNKPQSFEELDEQDPVFYLYIPNIWIGYRF